jgi:hypothetical protein
MRGGKRHVASICCCYIKKRMAYTAAIEVRMTWLLNKLTPFSLSVNDFEH